MTPAPVPPDAENPEPQRDELVTGYITGDQESLRFVDAMTAEEFAKFERRIDEAFADPPSPAGRAAASPGALDGLCGCGKFRDRLDAVDLSDDDSAPAAIPDPPRTVLDPETGIEEPVTTGRIPDAEFVEPPLMPPAASPDERLREALLSDAAVEAAAMTYEPDTFIGDAPNADDALRDARAVLEAALAAADRDTPDEPRDTRTLEDVWAGVPDPPECRAPHCWSEYGTPCGDCPTLAGARKDTDSASVVAPPPNPYRDLSVTTREGAKHYAWKMGYAAGVVVGKSLPSTGTGWDRGYAAGVAAERDQAWRWTIHVCPKGHKSLEPPLNGVCWKCWPGGRGPAEEHTAIRVAEVRR